MEDKCLFWKAVRDSNHTCAAMEMRLDEWGNEVAWCEASWENCPVLKGLYKMYEDRREVEKNADI